MIPNSPTNQPPPTDYLSVRITLPHDVWYTIVSSILFDSDVYIAYPHVGTVTQKPHWHILIPTISSTATKDGERYRKRVKSAKLCGNESFSIKKQSNGILCGIQYCSREHTRPMVAGPDTQHWIDIAPSWVDRDQSVMATKPVKERLGSPTLTLSNVVKQCLKYSRQHPDRHHVETANMTEILHLMVQDGWTPSRDILTKGIPRALHDEYLMCISRKPRAPHLWMYPTDPTEDQLRWRERPDITPMLVLDPPATVCNRTLTHERSRDPDGVFKAPFE